MVEFLDGGARTGCGGEGEKGMKDHTHTQQQKLQEQYSSSTNTNTRHERGDFLFFIFLKMEEARGVLFPGGGGLRRLKVRLAVEEQR